MSCRGSSRGVPPPPRSQVHLLPTVLRGRLHLSEHPPESTGLGGHTPGCGGFLSGEPISWPGDQGAALARGLRLAQPDTKRNWRNGFLVLQLMGQRPAQETSLVFQISLPTFSLILSELRSI